MRSLLMLAAVAAAYALLRGVPADWPTELRAALAVAVLGGAMAWWRRTDRRQAEALAGPRRARWTECAAMGAVLLGVELVFYGVLVWTPAPLERAAADLEAWLRPEAAAERREEASGQAGPQRGNWLWSDRRRRELPVRADFRPGNRPEIFLEPEPDGRSLAGDRLYVQAFALDRYENGAWSLNEEKASTLRADNDGWLRIADEAAGEIVRCRVYHGADGGGGHPVSGPQGLVAARVPEATRLGAGFFRLRLPPGSGGGYEYDTLSRPVALDDLAGESAEPPEDAADAWLAVPRGRTGTRIAGLARAVSGEGTSVERLRRIRNHLRTTLDYSLEIANPDGRAPLENFLFHEQRGHCEFFATAGALMARSIGVPARIRYGWSGGTYYENSGFFVFRADEAHAWTEVLLDGHGWVVLDPTPASGLPAGAPRVAAPDEEMPGRNGVERTGSGAEPGAPWWLLGVPALLLPAAGVWLLRRTDRLAWRRADPDRLPGGSPQEPSYWRAFLGGCRARGVEVTPGSTMRSLLARLEDPPGCASRLADYHYGVRYEERRPDRHEEKTLARELRFWAEAGG